MITFRLGDRNIKIHAKIVDCEWGEWFVIQNQIGYSGLFCAVKAESMSAAHEAFLDSNAGERWLKLDDDYVDGEIYDHVSDISEYNPVRPGFYEYLEKENAFRRNDWIAQPAYQKEWNKLSNEEQEELKTKSRHYCEDHGIMSYCGERDYFYNPETLHIYHDVKINFFAKECDF